MDSFLFFLGWLLRGIFFLTCGMMAAHALPVAVAYFRNGYGLLRYVPKALPGVDQLKEVGIHFYPNVEFTAIKTSDRYKLEAVHWFSNHNLPVLYYLLSVAYQNEPTYKYIVLPTTLRNLLLSIADCVRQHRVEKGETSLIGRYAISYYRPPTEYLRDYHRNDQWDRVLLQRNFVQMGSDACGKFLIRDVLFEVAKHLGAQVRADMKTWQIPALRTAVIQ